MVNSALSVRITPITPTFRREGSDQSTYSLGSVKVCAFAIRASAQGLECWNNGMMEYWGETARALFHYSIIPFFLLFVSFISPIRIFRMFQIPQRAAAPHLRQSLEVVFGRRRRCGPLQGPGVPGIITRRCPAAQRPKEIDHQAANARDLKESPNRRDHIVDFPPAARVIGINTPRHAEDAGDMLRVESKMKADEEKPEMPETQFLVKHPAHRFWIPVVNSGKDGERKTTDQHVMKVRHHEVRVGQLPVERRHG